MYKLQRLYRDNINGIIVTLAIHLVVLAGLFFARLKNYELIPQQLFVDLTATEIRPAETDKTLTAASQGSDVADRNRSGQHYSNRAVNDGDRSARSSSDPFFDREYEKEVAAAEQLERDVNANLAKKIPDIGDVSMPVNSTEGMTREEVRKSNFKGKSNIHYQVGNRYHLQLPIPVYLARGGGEVVVDILVNRNGEVVSANPRAGANLSDETILAYAKQAAEKTVFNTDNQAPERERGTIRYLFVAQ